MPASQLNYLEHIKKDTKTMLYDYINHEFYTGAEKRLGRIGVSDIGGCPRKVGYKLDGIMPTDIPPSVGAFHDGTTLHDDTQKMLRDIYPSRFHSMEKEFSLELGGASIKGHVDGILDPPVDLDPKYPQEPVVVEIKTANSRSWGFRFPVKDGYLIQAHGYMMATGLKATLFIYRKKDFLEWDTEIVHYDPEIAAEVEERVTRLLGSREHDRIEPQWMTKGKGKKALKYKALNWECNYCSYRTKCWEGEDIDEFDTNKWRVK